MPRLWATASCRTARRTRSDDYLLALDSLTSPVVECGAVADAPTVAAHVAQVLGVSRPAAGEMLGRLEDAGFVSRGAHKDVLLTHDGRAAADWALRRQRILECFAVQTLGYGIGECYERAREIAEGFTDESLDRMWVVLERPDRCPHGWPVDAEQGRHESRGLLALSSAGAIAAVEVERVDETSRERLAMLLESGISPGETLLGDLGQPGCRDRELCLRRRAPLDQPRARRLGPRPRGVGCRTPSLFCAKPSSLARCPTPARPNTPSGHSPSKKRARSRLESPCPRLTSRAVISLAHGAEGGGCVRGESSVRPVRP